MVWTDSQDYGADEILSHPFALTPPVQRAACALHFEGSLQEPTEIIKLTNHPPTLFNISHSSEGCVPLFSPYFPHVAAIAATQSIISFFITFVFLSNPVNLVNPVYLPMCFFHDTHAADSIIHRDITNSLRFDQLKPQRFFISMF